MKLLLSAILAFGAVVAFGAEPVAPGTADEIPVPELPPERVVAEPDEADAVALPALPPITAGADDKVTFYVIPIRDQIGKPTLFIIRNGVKDAIAANADCIILDMDTPGGEVGSTLEIMEILARFEGTTVTFIDSNAISAGAFISAATDRIYFSPSGVIGAAAPVSGGGEDINETMKQKVVSYLRARIRSISEEHPYRGDVVSAMIDANFELKIDDVVIKPKGELLSLTAKEATAAYGEPPQRLLGAGIEDDLPALYRALAGPASVEVKRFETTWSLDVALWLMRLSPLLLAAGGVLLMIEFKTPGFGVFGVTGIVLLLLVFFGHNVAGLSGHEPALFFLLGVALVFVEILFLPGTLIFGGVGILIILGSLLWGMADIWPSDVEGVSLATFAGPAFTLALGFLIGVLGFLVAARFLPETTLWNRLVLAADIHGTATGRDPAVPDRTSGQVGVVVSPLRPTGAIEIGGERYEARSDLGEVAIGAQVRVVRRDDFVLVVERVES